MRKDHCYEATGVGYPGAVGLSERGAPPLELAAEQVGTVSATASAGWHRPRQG